MQPLTPEWAELHAQLAPLIGRGPGQWSAQQVVRHANLGYGCYAYLLDWGINLGTPQLDDAAMDRLRDFVRDFATLVPGPHTPNEITDRLWEAHGATFMSCGIHSVSVSRTYSGPNEAGQVLVGEPHVEIMFWGHHTPPIQYSMLPADIRVLLEQMLIDLRTADPPMFVEPADIFIEDGLVPC